MFLFQNFAPNMAKVINRHVWTTINIFNRFLIFKYLSEKFFGHGLYVNASLNTLNF